TVGNELGFEGAKQLIGNSIYYAQGDTRLEEYPRLSRAPVPPNRWVCAELASGGSGPLVRRIWMDGKELTELGDRRTTPTPAPAFDLVTIGLQQYHPIDALSDVWIDDVRVSAQPIGCQP